MKSLATFIVLALVWAFVGLAFALTASLPVETCFLSFGAMTIGAGIALFCRSRM